MTQVEYTGIIGTPWEEPYDPGTISLIATGTPPINAAQIVRLHGGLWCVHTTHANVEQALKPIIVEAYTNMYTSQLEDYLLQYANRSALEILVHLKTTYGFINPTQLAENYNKMTAPISFQDPIETLFKQIEDGVRYASAGVQPYMGAASEEVEDMFWCPLWVMARYLAFLLLL
jgi:hypothetical protein